MNENEAGNVLMFMAKIDSFDCKFHQVVPIRRTPTTSVNILSNLSTFCFPDSFFVGLAISRRLSTTPHPMNRARGQYNSRSLLYDRKLAHDFIFFVAVVRCNHRFFITAAGSVRALAVNVKDLEDHFPMKTVFGG